MLDQSIEINDAEANKFLFGDVKDMYEQLECETSFYIFSKSNRIRIIFYSWVQNTKFELLIIFLIVLSSLKLVIDTYTYNTDKDGIFRASSGTIDTFFTISFLLESILKGIAFGFVYNEGSYLREGWNQLDFFIVATSVIDLLLTDIDIPAIKVFRMLRTMRPLRFISHTASMKSIVAALIKSIGHIINVAIVVVIVWLMFAIMGVNLFSGKF